MLAYSGELGQLLLSITTRFSSSVEGLPDEVLPAFDDLIVRTSVERNLQDSFL